MPPVHTHTIDEDDEGDICPVCDGECTCTPLPSNPLSMAELSLKYSSPSSGNSYPPSTPTPPLKIKLSIPPSMLANRRIQSTSKLSKSAAETTLDSANAGYTTIPKKRGRPPKAFASPPNQKKTLFVPKSNGKRPALKARAAIVKKVAAAKNKKRRRVATSDEDSSSSSALSDVGMEGTTQPDPYPDDDSLQFPTFLSASALSSNDSDSDSSSSLSDFSDSSIEAEEENFILADLNNKKSRVKRELFHDDKKRTSHNNDWIIRPRKKSEGPSDVEMNDVDSDATEQDDQQDDADQDDEEDDADATEEEMAMTLDDEDDVTTDDHHRRYVGHATGWSEEEDESSFDADLFFANLSGSDSIDSDSDDDGTSSAPRHYKHPSLSMAEDGDQSDISGSGMLSECTESGWTGRRRAELESLPFEVTEGWDGQIMFTNGVGDGQGLVDIEFEADAERFVASPRKRRRQRGQLIGIHMEESDDDDDGMEGSDVDMSDGGYEEEDGGEGGEGDTTDEELVGEDELPNERAMALFSLPLSVSAINPLSTVSSPMVPASRRGLGRRMWGMESPSPADILAGRAVFWDSDDELSPKSGSDDAGREDSAKRNSLPLGPRKGVFSPSMEMRQAVIGEDRKGAEVPSPHPRFNRGRGRTNVGRFSAVEHLLRRHLLADAPANHQASSPVLGAPSSSIQEETASSIQQLLLSSVAAAATTSADDNKTTSTPALQSIELDDVLEASFLHDSEGRDATDDGANNAVPPSSDNESGGVRNLSRWDLISVGAFRQTRESWEGARHHPHHPHTPGSTADYGSVMKSSPMASMLWQNGGGSSGANGRPASAPSTVKGKGHGYGKLAKRRQLMMSASTMSSPLILPLSSSSLGTPVALQPAASITSTPPTTKSDGDDLKKLHHQQQQQQQHQKSRKEQRRERKSMKKKSSYGGPVHQIHAHHHGHHSHHHHPNSKNRSASSTQRSNFSAMGVPPLNL